MYQQSNTSYDSVGRRSSHNPFRQPSGSNRDVGETREDFEAREIRERRENRTPSATSSTSAFDDWVHRNKGLMTDSSDDEPSLARPTFPAQTRTGSDTNVNYGRKMSSNNPFAAAMAGEYKHHRDPPPPPTQTTRAQSPSKDPSTPKMAPPPPSYEEAAGPRGPSKSYPREKETREPKDKDRREPKDPKDPRSRSRPHRSHSDSAKHDAAKHKERKARRAKEKKKAVAPHQPKNLDVIDKLDVSAFFGGRFHHDGPFDACAPHRNKNVKAAPVMAFPADGPNTSMKASAPNDNMDLAFGNFEDQNMIVGRSAKEHSAAGSQPRALGAQVDVPRLNPSVVAFDANEKAAPIHGLSTAGLGSTTFLNGAPAPKTEEYLSPPGAKSGLGRKKSLVQRLRKNSGSESTSRRNSNDSSGEYRRSSFADEDGGSSLLQRVKSLKVGRK